jgi:hypothetical protein
MDALDAIVQAQLGTTEDGSTAIAWAGRCPRPWLHHDAYPGSHVANAGTCNYQAGSGAFDPNEIAQAEQLPMLHLYGADAQGYAQAMVEHPDLPWHQLHWLSVDSDECESLHDAVQQQRDAWEQANPQVEGEP